MGLWPLKSVDGLFVSRTRLLSVYRYLVDGKPPKANVVGNVKQHSWLGYYIELPPHWVGNGKDQGSGQMEEISEEKIELRVSRHVGQGIHEALDFTNFTQQLTSFHFELELDADFADQAELQQGKREQQGNVQREWRQTRDGLWELSFDYSLEHPYSHQGNAGVARLRRALAVRIARSDSPPSYSEGRITFPVALSPRGTWHACIQFIPSIEGHKTSPQDGCKSFFEETSPTDRLRESFLRTATKFRAPVSGKLTSVVVALLERAKEDLVALRLYDLDHRDDAWVMAAGLPLYVALFGRDTLTASWEAALLGPEMMRGTLADLPRCPGTEF